MSALATEECGFITRKEAADYLRRHWHQRVSAQSLALYAHRKEGPPYFLTSTGSNAFYRRSDLDEWALGRLVPGGTPIKKSA